MTVPVHGTHEPRDASFRLEGRTVIYDRETGSHLIGLTDGGP